MIKTDIIFINGRLFKKTYSDTYKIRKGGTNEVYNEAIDLLTSEYEYEETKELINVEETKEEL